MDAAVSGWDAIDARSDDIVSVIHSSSTVTVLLMADWMWYGPNFAELVLYRVSRQSVGGGYG